VKLVGAGRAVGDAGAERDVCAKSADGTINTAVMQATDNGFRIVPLNFRVIERGL